MSYHPPKLSLCMIVRNEEQHLTRCLESIQDIDCQKVIVDTGSTDQTIAIAESFSADIIHHTWQNDFAAARNVSLAAAKNPWILVLDADEWLTAESRIHLSKLIEQPPDRAFELIQKNIGANGHITLNPIVRLFPNRATIRYLHKVHEDVLTSLNAANVPIEKTNITLEHTGYTDTALVLRKRERNKTIMQAALKVGPSPETAPHLYYNLGSIFHGEKQFTEALEHFQWCLDNTDPDSRIAKIVRLQSADCYFQLNQFQQALPLLPEHPTPHEHPAALMLKARILHKSNPLRAEPWLAALLNVPDTIHAPPVPLAPLKLGAVSALGEIWLNQKNLNIAKALLELAQKMKSNRINAASEEIGLHYHSMVNNSAVTQF